MGEILEKLDTLTTEERLTAYLNMQLRLLKEDGQASREAMEHFRPERKKRHGQTMGGM